MVYRMKTILEYLLSKDKTNLGDESELQHMLDTEQDGMKILDSKEYQSYLGDDMYYSALVPSFVRRNKERDVMTGELWVIYASNLDEEDDPYGEVCPYWGLCKDNKCLWEDAKKAYTGKLKRQIDSALK